MKENLNTRLTILHDEIDQFKLEKHYKIDN